VEALHTIGLSILLWRILPKLTIVESSVVFSAVGMVPAFLHIFSGNREGPRAKAIAVLILDALACVLQISGLIGLSVLLHKKHGW